MQAKIRKQRQEQLYAQAELRQKIFNIVGIVLLCTIIGGVVMWIGYLFYLKRTGNL
jgi:TM2 domain-containing membrane protein YozV